MKNITNNLIIYSLILLAFLMLGATVIALMPQEAKAYVVESDSMENGMRNVTYSFDGGVDTAEVNVRLLPEKREYETVTYTQPAPTKPTATKTASTTTKKATTAKSTTKAVAEDTSSRDLSGLAAGAIFGGDGFMPSGIVQWLLLAIFILLIVIIVRKIFGEKQYHESPLKHA